MIYHEWPDMLQYMDKNVKIYQIPGNIMLFRNSLVNLSMYLIPRSDLVNLSIYIYHTPQRSGESVNKYHSPERSCEIDQILISNYLPLLLIYSVQAPGLLWGRRYSRAGNLLRWVRT